MTIRFIGDVHGKFHSYATVLKNSPYPTIQVGDMGVGFSKTDPRMYGEPSANPPYDLMVAGKHRFIRGNHDNPKVCQEHRQCIDDGYTEGSMMFVGGAFSIDWQWRTKDFTWWEDEELSQDRLKDMAEIFRILKPRIMVTHTAPTEICDLHITEMTMPGYPGGRLAPSSRTEAAFQEMFEEHQPELWVYGHWHRNTDHVVNGTRFVCLDELCTLDVKV